MEFNLWKIQIMIWCCLRFQVLKLSLAKFRNLAGRAGKQTNIHHIVFSHKIVAICVFDIALKCIRMSQFPEIPVTVISNF